MIKSGPYFLLVSCDSTVCSLWKICGGRKEEGFPPPSDMTLRWPDFVGLVSWSPVSIGVSDGGTVTAEGKQKDWCSDWLTGLSHLATHWLVLICDPRGMLQVSSDLMVCYYNSSASDWRGLIHQCLQQWQLGGQQSEGVLTGQMNRKRKWGWRQRGLGGRRSSL